MEARQHAHLARLLVAACGGVDEVVRNQACRLKASRLYDCMDPTTPGSMPVDVVADLEAYCGDPLYSRALVAARPHAPEPGPLIEEACESCEAAASLQRLVRTSLKDGHLSFNETQAIEVLVHALEQRCGHVRAAAFAEGRRPS
ncbi:MAG: hypothetical protein P4L73_20690 [Caulobacteraceae bacterium]|nr:hypothetical protein [Caulobacteraceae bacterium]